MLYSSALQRLAYVTQVTAPESGHTFHNRLGHSLKVAQVGRRNAERLRKLAERGDIVGASASLIESVDPDAVETCCLAHDIGHPPFGHIAEKVLNEEARDHMDDGGFEGNAQSFRIVTRLSVRSPEPGLDLTRQSLDGILKYPWKYWPVDPLPRPKRHRKWGYYRVDSPAFAFAREHWPAETRDVLPARSIEAEIMDWADDVTYAVHDVDDFFRAGLIPLDRLGQRTGAERNRFRGLLADAELSDSSPVGSYSLDELVETVTELVALYGPTDPYEHTVAARASLRDFGSKLITEFLEAFTLEDDAENGGVKLRIDDVALRRVAALKALVAVYVIRRPGLAVVQHGQERMVRELFHAYFKASAPGEDGDRRIFPPGAKAHLEEGADPSARARAVVDLIAGMTETAAIQLHRRLTGGWTASALDATAAIG